MIRKQIGFFVFIATILLTGCFSIKPGTVNTKFYTLKSTQKLEASVQASKSTPSVSIGRIQMPAYLERLNIARRAGGSEIIYSDTARWAENVDLGVARVVAQDLSIYLNSRNVTTFPWVKAFEHDFDIYLNLVEFIANTRTKKIELSGTWRLVEAKLGGQTLEVGEFRFDIELSLIHI